MKPVRFARRRSLDLDSPDCGSGAVLPTASDAIVFGVGVPAVKPVGDGGGGGGERAGCRGTRGTLPRTPADLTAKSCPCA